jgi:4-hydroxy-3-polyprenylbenzoate decarboxylase
VDDDIAPIAEISERSLKGPAILFSGIQGYDPTYRILLNPISSLDRVALTVGFPLKLTKADHCDLWLDKTRSLKPIPPRVVTDGPVLENVQAGSDVDLRRFPAPIWHGGDGGRYIGTGCFVISKDPDGGWVNLGTYRVMVVDQNHVTIYSAPGKHLSIVRDKLFAQGKSAPVAISLGHDPALLLGGSTPLPYGESEYDYAGALKGQAVEVLHGEHTGLPIPARGEIILEGEISPTETCPEGPFGEWPGYYASGQRTEFVTKIHRVYPRGSGARRDPQGGHTGREARLVPRVRQSLLPRGLH